VLHDGFRNDVRQAGRQECGGRGDQPAEPFTVLRRHAVEVAHQVGHAVGVVVGASQGDGRRADAAGRQVPARAAIAAGRVLAAAVVEQAALVHPAAVPGESLRKVLVAHVADLESGQRPSERCGRETQVRPRRHHASRERSVDIHRHRLTGAHAAHAGAGGPARARGLERAKRDAPGEKVVSPARLRGARELPVQRAREIRRPSRIPVERRSGRDRAHPPGKQVVHRIGQVLDRVGRDREGHAERREQALMLGPQPAEQAVQRLEGPRRARFLSRADAVEAQLHPKAGSLENARLPPSQQEAVGRDLVRHRPSTPASLEVGHRPPDEGECQQRFAAHEEHPGAWVSGPEQHVERRAQGCPVDHAGPLVVLVAVPTPQVAVRGEDDAERRDLAQAHARIAALHPCRACGRPDTTSSLRSRHLQPVGAQPGPQGAAATLSPPGASRESWPDTRITLTRQAARSPPSRRPSRERG